MPSAFVIDNTEGLPAIECDPDSDLDYAITSWLEGMDFLSVVFAIDPTGPVIYNSQVNDAPMTIDGVDYAIGKLAMAWIRGPFTAGATYRVTISGTFTGNRKDDRSFLLKCKER